MRKGEKTSYFLVTALRVRLNERLSKLLSHAPSIFYPQSLVSFLKSSCLKYLNELLGYIYLPYFLSPLSIGNVSWFTLFLHYFFFCSHAKDRLAKMSKSGIWMCVTLP